MAEGSRLIDDILNSQLSVSELYHTPNWQHANIHNAEQAIEVTSDEMKKISSLSSPPRVLAVVKTPLYDINTVKLNNRLTIALDCVQDPGNLGTIIRLADWFGIDHILCTDTTADAFAPKVVQASMGAITRVQVIYCNLVTELEKLRNSMPIYGAFMEGENIYSSGITPLGIVVLGNEGNGISSEIERLITSKIHIPSFATSRTNVESLNVAMATAIICSEFCRRK